MGDNRQTVGYVVISRVHGGVSWCKAERFLCNTDPVAEVFPTRELAQQAIEATVRYGQSHKFRFVGWRKDNHDVVRCVRGRK